MKQQSVLVIGAGFMGSGIAQVCAQSGYRVHLNDVKPEALGKAEKGLQWSVNKLTEKGFLQEDPDKILNRLTYETDLSSAAEADWIIEAVLEVEALKIDLFKALEEKIPATTPLATNTSSIPITRIASHLNRPERVLGLHFFGPVPFMGLVEVVKGERTGDNVFEAGVDFITSLGKTPVRVKRDIPGFVMNRIFSAAFREAVDLVSDGIVSPEDVDAGMRLGYGWNVGPFEVADNAGLDTFVLVGQSMAELGEENLVTKSDLLQKMIEQGRLGKKAGKGFYRYTKDGKRLPYGEGEA
ncbi:MAG: 3-hydroxybutyryl-CoA dehydrogenase [Deltaproteobacteria bacterium]|nr:MAG: 3-hydroxybutyryl-CoA dehydrogenase [Deltaproteobacteria bacterium]RLC11647.1 MAG: 3-hydroxybutyryl-CoA dehydrogenase [Deltaproteobacteria bacterium]